MVKKILVVDSDREVKRLLLETFHTIGYNVVAAENGDAAVRMIETESFDLVILEIMIPGTSGFQILRQLRKTSDIPVIILSARADTIDKVETFELGADDYVTKPFIVAELTARVAALLRRTDTKTRIGVKAGFNDGRLLVDFTKHQVFVDGKDAAITKKEYELLREFILNAGNVLEYQYLLKHVWGIKYQGNKNRVKTIVRRLRGKIEADLRKPQYILAVKGVGYRFKDNLS
jgi:two-component system, OmpR family, alkaline phosphatase synthesis response regulator PhoP